MRKDCIVPVFADRLKKAFKNGEISIEALYNAKSSAERVQMLRKYVGDGAEKLTATLEKSFLSPNQKLALRNWVFKNIAGVKPLYNGVTLEQAKAMADGIDIRSLRKMTDEQRIDILSQYVSKDMAESLNDRFNKSLKSGNLQNWEERTFGTKKLREDKRLKGAVSRLEALDDMGVLNPEQLEKFMQSFVEDKLGISLDIEESQKLSELIEQQRSAYDKILESDDWTARNSNNILDYFDKRKKLEDYTDELTPSTGSTTINNIINIMRANILASVNTLRNSALYQILPGIERTITKRLVSGNFSDSDINSGVVEKILSKMSGIKFGKDDVNFIKDQVKMAIKIYHKTGYDISRMDTLESGFKYFGESATKFSGKSFKESKGFVEKTEAILRAIGRTVNLAPKWMAGGTDMLFANIGRADTALMLSKEIAHMEAIKGKLPDDMTEQQRAEQLLRESYSFDPKDPKAQMIRESGILDANMMNNTQPETWSNLVVKMRDNLRIGNVRFGKAIIPFAKIASVVLSEGIKTTTGYGIIKSLYKINRAGLESNRDERARLMYDAVSNLIRYLGMFGAVMLIQALLDDDDYIGQYNSLTPKEYMLARARGANTNSISIGGHWVPLRYLPIISIPLSAVMSTRQAISKGDDPISGYLAGTISQILESPGIRETRDIYKNMSRAVKSGKAEKFIKSLGFDGDNMVQWARVRMLPAVLSRDLYNAVFPKDKKYDFLGNEIESGSIFHDDKTNRVLLEFNRLDKTGYFPAIYAPSGDYIDKIVSSIGESKYRAILAKLQRNYAKEVENTIDRPFYKKAPDRIKKKILNKIRKSEILDKLHQISSEY